jgi:hypothetical protein
MCNLALTSILRPEARAEKGDKLRRSVFTNDAYETNWDDLERAAIMERVDPAIRHVSSYSSVSKTDETARAIFNGYRGKPSVRVYPRSSRTRLQ